MTSIYDIEIKNLQNNPIQLSNFKGKHILFVNVASKCGFTPQYEGLENLYKSHEKLGLKVLGFPCNQFGRQEPGTNDEICAFAKSKGATQCLDAPPGNWLTISSNTSRRLADSTIRAPKSASCLVSSKPIPELAPVIHILDTVSRRLLILRNPSPSG